MRSSRSFGSGLTSIVTSDRDGALSSVVISAHSTKSLVAQLFNGSCRELSTWVSKRFSKEGVDGRCFCLSFSRGVWATSTLLVLCSEKNELEENLSIGNFISVFSNEF